MTTTNRLGRGFPWGVVIAGGLILAVTIGSLIFLAISSDVRKGKVNAEADEFQLRYWQKPIPLQGKPPESHAEPAKGILPENCGLCHYQQFQDWKESLHALAMGPGVMGQFPSMDHAGQASCQECHAPMTEQWAKVGNGSGGWRENTAFDAALQGKGLVCSACHLRRHKRFGPPLSEKRRASGTAAASALIHGDPVRTDHFRASEFCKGCHQHLPNSMKVGGKTVENTYNEWLESKYAEEGVTCQDCHMPGGRHYWRGIHDPETTLSGVSIQTSIEADSGGAELVAGESVIARLTLKNTGTGHNFPTYTTPAVFLKAAFLDQEGRVLQGGYYEEKILQRRLDMSLSPWGEFFDTRVPPDEMVELEFSRTVPAEAAELYLWVWVEPDHFYTGFYRSYLGNGEDFSGKAELQEALDQSLDNRYVLFSRKIPVRKSH